MKYFQLTSAITVFLLSFGLYASPVNINTASADKIAESLSGVGANKAQAIVQYRKLNGLFKNAVDIVQVKGIGQSIYNKNKADILIK